MSNDPSVAEPWKAMNRPSGDQSLGNDTLNLTWIWRSDSAMRPAAAPPYVVAYGGFALIVGLVIGVFLRTTGLLMLKLHQRCHA